MNFLRQLIQKPLSSTLLFAIPPIPPIPAIREEEGDLKIAKIGGIANRNLPLTQSQKSLLFLWLADIGETNAEAIADVIRQCQEDIAVRNYFLGVAMAHKKANADISDDRRYCYQCVNLSPTGLCLAAGRGEIKASRNYHPMGDLPFRCEGYQPIIDDPDQRHPFERWPGLFNKKFNRTCRVKS